MNRKKSVKQQKDSREKDRKTDVCLWLIRGPRRGQSVLVQSDAASSLIDSWDKQNAVGSGSDVNESLCQNLTDIKNVKLNFFLHVQPDSIKLLWTFISHVTSFMIPVISDLNLRIRVEPHCFRMKVTRRLWPTSDQTTSVSFTSASFAVCKKQTVLRWWDQTGERWRDFTGSFSRQEHEQSHMSTSWCRWWCKRFETLQVKSIEDADEEPDVIYCGDSCSWSQKHVRVRDAALRSDCGFELMRVMKVNLKSLCSWDDPCWSWNNEGLTWVYSFQMR